MKAICSIAMAVLLLCVPALTRADEPDAPKDILWTCGSANGDAMVTLADPMYIANYIFGGSAPVPVEAGNADNSCLVNMADVIYLTNYLYKGGPAPFGCSLPTGCTYSVNTNDTVRIGSPPYTPYAGNDSVAIPIYFSNAATIYGLTVGFHYTSGSFEITSVSKAGSVIASGQQFMTDTVQNKFLVGWWEPMSGRSAQIGGLMVTLNARITSGPVTQSISLDSAFVNPSGDFIFVNGSASATRPVFVKPPLRLSVTTVDGAGVGSLRAAINDANTNAGLDTIFFDISGTIALTVPLPALIDDSTVILGSTAPGGDWSVVLDGSAISGGGDGLVIQSRDNVVEGLTIKNFPGNGISVTGALSVRNRLTRNLIYRNNGLAIDLGADGITINDVGDVDTGPNDLLNYPVVDTIYDGMDGKYYLVGQASDSAIVEFYVAHPAGQSAEPEDPSGHGEAYTYVGADTCDSDGNLNYAIPYSYGNFSRISTIAIDTLGNTSEFSENFYLIPAPLIVVAYSPVNIIITDPDDLQYGRDSLNIDITGIPDGHYFVTPNDSVIIDHPKWGEYIIQFVTEAGTPPGAMYSAIIKIDGTDQVAIAAEDLVPMSGTMATFTYDVEEGYHYLNADANRDSLLDVGDAVFIINYVFKGGPAPYPTEAADANCDHVINVGDAVHIINYIFKGGPSPCFFEK